MFRKKVDSEKRLQPYSTFSEPHLLSPSLLLTLPQPVRSDSYHEFQVPPVLFLLTNNNDTATNKQGI